MSTLEWPNKRETAGSGTSFIAAWPARVWRGTCERRFASTSPGRSPGHGGRRCPAEEAPETARYSAGTVSFALASRCSFSLRSRPTGSVAQPCSEMSKTTPLISLYFSSAWRPS